MDYRRTDTIRNLYIYMLGCLAFVTLNDSQYYCSSINMTKS